MKMNNGALLFGIEIDPPEPALGFGMFNIGVVAGGNLLGLKPTAIVAASGKPVRCAGDSTPSVSASSTIALVATWKRCAGSTFVARANQRLNAFGSVTPSRCARTVAGSGGPLIAVTANAYTFP